MLQTAPEQSLLPSPATVLRDGSVHPRFPKCPRKSLFLASASPPKAPSEATPPGLASLSLPQDLVSNLGLASPFLLLPCLFPNDSLLCQAQLYTQLK